ncbi:MAG: hypothetical protein AAF871_09385 [Pseudomonadota bacterium]
MRLKPYAPVFAVCVAAGLIWLLVPWVAVFAWTVEAQRGFQEAMARALRAVQAGEALAVVTLCTATFAYGFVHALGPGHGKVLLGGAAVASGTDLRRMTVLTVLASIAQALSAILLVGVLAVLFGIGTAEMGELADTWLASASYAAIALIGAYLVWRGIRLWRPAPSHGHCCHAHGPTAEDVATLHGFRDGAMLVGSIALRPCTGAVFLLAIALRFDLFWTGCLAVVTMGLGTAVLNLLVAWSAVAARRLSTLQALASHELRRVSSGLHILGGGFITAISVSLLLRIAA